MLTEQDYLLPLQRLLPTPSYSPLDQESRIVTSLKLSTTGSRDTWIWPTTTGTPTSASFFPFNRLTHSYASEPPLAATTQAGQHHPLPLILPEPTQPPAPTAVTLTPAATPSSASDRPVFAENILESLAFYPPTSIGGQVTFAVLSLILFFCLFRLVVLFSHQLKIPGPHRWIDLSYICAQGLVISVLLGTSIWKLATNSSVLLVSCGLWNAAVTVSLAVVSTRPLLVGFCVCFQFVDDRRHLALVLGTLWLAGLGSGLTLMAVDLWESWGQQEFCSNEYLNRMGERYFIPCIVVSFFSTWVLSLISCLCSLLFSKIFTLELVAGSIFITKLLQLTLYRSNPNLSRSSPSRFCSGGSGGGGTACLQGIIPSVMFCDCCYYSNCYCCYCPSQHRSSCRPRRRWQHTQGNKVGPAPEAAAAGRCPTCGVPVSSIELPCQQHAFTITTSSNKRLRKSHISSSSQPGQQRSGAILAILCPFHCLRFSPGSGKAGQTGASSRQDSLASCATDSGKPFPFHRPPSSSDSWGSIWDPREEMMLRASGLFSSRKHDSHSASGSSNSLIIVREVAPEEEEGLDSPAEHDDSRLKNRKKTLKNGHGGELFDVIFGPKPDLEIGIEIQRLKRSQSLAKKTVTLKDEEDKRASNRFTRSTSDPCGHQQQPQPQKQPRILEEENEKPSTVATAPVSTSACVKQARIISNRNNPRRQPITRAAERSMSIADADLITVAPSWEPADINPAIFPITDDEIEACMFTNRATTSKTADSVSEMMSGGASQPRKQPYHDRSPDSFGELVHHTSGKELWIMMLEYAIIYFPLITGMVGFGGGSSSSYKYPPSQQQQTLSWDFYLMSYLLLVVVLEPGLKLAEAAIGSWVRAVSSGGCGGSCGSCHSSCSSRRRAEAETTDKSPTAIVL